eukprot:349903-Chlamydomonas_euryale.AAC.2
MRRALLRVHAPTLRLLLGLSQLQRQSRIVCSAVPGPPPSPPIRLVYQTHRRPRSGCCAASYLRWSARCAGRASFLALRNAKQSDDTKCAVIRYVQLRRRHTGGLPLRIVYTSSLRHYHRRWIYLSVDLRWRATKETRSELFRLQASRPETRKINRHPGPFGPGHSVNTEREAPANSRGEMAHKGPHPTENGPRFQMW